LLNIDTTWRVKDTPFPKISDGWDEAWNEREKAWLRTDSLLNYITSETSFPDATYQLLPGTIPQQKADQFNFSCLTIRYYDSLTAKEFGTKVEILDSIDHPKAYFLRIDYERAIEETRISEEHGYTAVWNLDSLSCLLFIRDTRENKLEK